MKKKNNIWYHGTTREAWEQIVKDGFLWGKPKNSNRRFTYLAREKEEANLYGEVTIQVNYNPEDDLENNNYTPECLDMKVSSQISISRLKKIN